MPNSCRIFRRDIQAMNLRRQCIFGHSVIQVNRVRLNVRHGYRNIRRRRFHGGNATAAERACLRLLRVSHLEQSACQVIQRGAKWKRRERAVTSLEY